MTPEEERNQSNEETVKTRANHSAYHHYHRHGGNPVGAIILIGLGAILLLQNFGLLPWGIWSTLWQFWPLVLILIGLQLVLGRSRLASFFLALIVFLIIAWLILASVASRNNSVDQWLQDRSGIDWHLRNMPMMWNREQTNQQTINLNEAQDLTSRQMNVTIPVGRFTLKDNSGDNPFTLSSIYPENWGPPEVKKTTSDGVLNIDINTSGHQDGVFSSIGRQEYNAELGLPELSTIANVNISTGSADIDLKRVKLRSITAKVSTGSMDIRLDGQSVPSDKSTYSVGTGSLDLSIPSSIGLRVRYDIGVGRLNIDNNRFSGDGTYTSPNYDSAARKLDLEVEVGTGSLDINRF